MLHRLKAGVADVMAMLRRTKGKGRLWTSFARGPYTAQFMTLAHQTMPGNMAFGISILKWAVHGPLVK